MDFQYHIKKEVLAPELQHVVIEFSRDRELEEFLEDSRKKPYSKVKIFFYNIFSQFIPLFGVDALFNMYPLYILSSAQWERIVPKRNQGGKLLDIGAGQGSVTLKAKKLFKEIVTTETSFFVGLRLLSKGFKCVLRDVAKYPLLFKEKEFDVVSILNVLDRSDYPLSLLRNSINFLKDDGVLVIATPLPISPAVWTTISRPPSEVLVERQTDSFEECLIDFCDNVLAPEKLRPILIGRLPYVCKSNDPDDPSYFDNVLIVCEKVPNA